MSAATYYLIVATKPSGGALFPPESGPLRREGKYLLDATGRVWFGRGLTMFLLYARYLRGEDITPELHYARDVGANYLRLFGQVPVPPWAPEWQFYSLPKPEQYGRLREFVDVVGDHGLRIEWVPVCGPWTAAAATELLQASYEALAGAWNVTLEWTNEPGQSGTFHENLHAFDAINRRGVLSATGVSALPPVDPQTGISEVAQQILGISKVTSFAQMHWTDYGTGHFNDTQHNRYPRVSKAARDWRDGDAEVGIAGNGCPTWLDEDCRIDDGESFPTLEDHVSHNALGGLFSGAQLVHYNAGKVGRMPQPGGLEDRVIRETSRIWQFIGPQSQTGTYSRPPLNDFPLVWTDTDSTVQHAYCSWTGSTGYCVNCLAPPGWAAVPKPGHTILAVGPRPWILKMGR